MGDGERPDGRRCRRCGEAPAARAGRCQACAEARDAAIDARYLAGPMRRADRLVGLMHEVHEDRGRQAVLFQVAATLELVGLWAYAKAVRLWARGPWAPADP